MTKAKAPAPVIDNSDRQWHVDRKVPVALIVTMATFFAGQTGTALWWASKTDARIESLEKASAVTGPQAATQGDRLTRVEVKVDNLISATTEIKDILRRDPPARR